MDIYWGSNQKNILSNLAPRKFSFRGKSFVSVEHAYQCWKSGKFDFVTHEKYLRHGNGGIKIRGLLLANGKNDLDIRIMRKLILESFKQNKAAREFLLGTKDEILTHNLEHTMWKYEFPKILMEVREILKNKNL